MKRSASMWFVVAAVLLAGLFATAFYNWGKSNAEESLLACYDYVSALAPSGRFPRHEPPYNDPYNMAIAAQCLGR